MSSPVTELLETAGLPADDLMTTRESLPEPVRLRKGHRDPRHARQSHSDLKEFS